MRIVPIAAPAEPSLSPDIVWDGLMGDFALAEAGEAGNRGGLCARAQLVTAVTICLMSDVRAEPEELRDGDVNRGWPGDSFDLDEEAGERPLGSKLWLLRRRTVDEIEVPRLAELYAAEALQTLIDQGAAAAVTAKAVGRPAQNRLDLSVTLTDRAGQTIVAPNYQLLWDELRG